MEQLNMVICDPNEQYVSRLAEFFASKKSFPYALWYFSQPASMLEFLNENPAEVLLVSDKLVDEQTEIDSAKRIFYLTADRQQSLTKEGYLYQYQSAENLLRAVYEAAEIPGELLRTQEIATDSTLIGFFTPIGRCLQSTMCLTIGQLLARNKRVLYLDLEGCSALPTEGNMTDFTGISKSSAGQFDLSDLIYYFVHSRDKFISKLTTMKRSIGGLDYIAPVRTYQDIQAVTGEDWIAFLRSLTESGLYEYIILDLGKEIQGIFQILSLCGSIITIERRDMASSQKLKQYDTMLSLLQMEAVKEHSHRYVLPKFADLPHRIEEYAYGELGRYGAKVIEEVLHEQL